MCTSFVHRQNGLWIGMNFDNDGKKFVLDTHLPDAFVVKVDGGFGLNASFGVRSGGVFANNLQVPPPPGGKGGFKRASKTRTYTQRLVQYLLDGTILPHQIEEYLTRMEIVNDPVNSCHNMVVGPQGNVWVVEPGRGVLRSPFGASDYFVMTNCPLCGAPGGGAEDDRYKKAHHLLSRQAVCGVNEAFGVLRAVRQKGAWNTEFSMVYHGGENAVYYCYGGAFAQVEKYAFPAG